MKRAVRSKRTSERFERTSKRMSGWPSTTVCIFGCSRPQCIRTYMSTLNLSSMSSPLPVPPSASLPPPSPLHSSFASQYCVVPAPCPLPPSPLPPVCFLLLSLLSLIHFLLTPTPFSSFPSSASSPLPLLLTPLYPFLPSADRFLIGHMKRKYKRKTNRHFFLWQKKRKKKEDSKEKQKKRQKSFFENAFKCGF